MAHLSPSTRQAVLGLSELGRANEDRPQLNLGQEASAQPQAVPLVYSAPFPQQLPTPAPSDMPPFEQNEEEEEVEEEEESSKKKARSTSSGQSRKDRSLGALCENFIRNLRQQSAGSHTFNLDEIARSLHVERRRIYDVINVLEAINIVERRGKSFYRWNGLSKVVEALTELHTEVEQKKKNLGITGESDDPRIFCEKPWRNEDEESKEDEEDAEEESSKKKSRSKKKDKSKEKEDKQTPKPRRQDLSLGHLSRLFIQLFLTSPTRLYSLDDCAIIMLGYDPKDMHPVEKNERNKDYKSKVRRLYDIANVLSGCGLVEKVFSRKERRPYFVWVGCGLYPLPLKINFNEYTNNQHTPSKSLELDVQKASRMFAYATNTTADSSSSSSSFEYDSAPQPALPVFTNNAGEQTIDVTHISTRPKRQRKRKVWDENVAPTGATDMSSAFIPVHQPFDGSAPKQQRLSFQAASRDNVAPLSQQRVQNMNPLEYAYYPKTVPTTLVSSVVRSSSLAGSSLSRVEDDNESSLTQPLPEDPTNVQTPALSAFPSNFSRSNSLLSGLLDRSNSLTSLYPSSFSNPLPVAPLTNAPSFSYPSASPVFQPVSSSRVPSALPSISTSARSLTPTTFMQAPIFPTSSPSLLFNPPSFTSSIVQPSSYINSSVLLSRYQSPALAWKSTHEQSSQLGFRTRSM